MLKKIIQKSFFNKKFKIMSSILIASTMSISTAFATTIVEKSGNITKLEVEPVTSDSGYMLVSLREMGNIMNCDVSWNFETSEATLTKGTFEIIVKSGDTNAMVNGRTSIMDTPGIISEGSMMVPIRFIAEAFNQDVLWIESERKVVIADKTNEVPVEDGVIAPAVREKIVRGDESLALILEYSEYIESIHSSLSFDEAVKMAYSENSTIDKLEYNLENMELQRSELTLSIFLTSMADSSLRALKSLDLTVLDTKEQMTTLAVLTEQSVMNTANSLITQKLDQISLLKSIENDERNFLNQTLLFELGEVSVVAYEEAKSNLEKLKYSYDLLILSEESEKQSANELLGKKVTDDISIEYRNIIFKPQNDDITNHIRVDQINDPNYHSLQRSLELAEYDVYTIREETEREVLALERAVYDAEQDIINYEKDYENKVRSYYNTLQTLQSQQASNYIDLDQAWEDYNTLYINYEAGNVTEYQLMLQEYSILSKEISIVRNYLQQSTTSFMLEYPYLSIQV